jgi:KamA family protein
MKKTEREDYQRKYKAFTRKNIRKIQEQKSLSEEIIEDVELVSLVFPFRVNNYVLEELINWDNIPQDPIFNINFPNKKMLKERHHKLLKSAVDSNKSKSELAKIINEIRYQLNPHPDGQLTYNVPEYKGEFLKGIQHKYQETVLAFPNEGQICHAFCTYCFRWPQFVGENGIKISLSNPNKLVEYIQENEEIQDVLFTGGDPMTMKAPKLSKYITPILESEIPHLKTIRIGTKSLSYWPYRFISDPDTGDVLRLFREISESELHLTIVANLNHPNELKTEELRKAVNNIHETGAIIRTQTPLLRNINNNSNCLATLWKEQANLGMIPYYLFITRDTGAKHYFEIPLVKAYRIFQRAYRKISGICRTVKGPVMSTTSGKIQIIGITNIGNSRIIVLKFIQGRNPTWVGRPFFAKYNVHATLFDELEPAFGKKFFYEYDLSKYLAPYRKRDANDVNEFEKMNEEIETKT